MTRCEICGEPFRMVPETTDLWLDEVGEFIDVDTKEHVIAHAQCGIDQEMEMA